MDLSLAKTEEKVELRAREKHRNTRRYSRAEAHGICALIVLYVSHIMLLRDELLSRTRILARHGGR